MPSDILRTLKKVTLAHDLTYTRLSFLNDKKKLLCTSMQDEISDVVLDIHWDLIKDVHCP